MKLRAAAAVKKKHQQDGDGTTNIVSSPDDDQQLPPKQIRRHLKIQNATENKSFPSTPSRSRWIVGGYEYALAGQTDDESIIKKN
jgi:hypothetical protein